MHSGRFIEVQVPGLEMRSKDNDAHQIKPSSCLARDGKK